MVKRRQRPAKKPKGWTIVMMGDRGAIRQWPLRPALGWVAAITVTAVIMVMGGMGALVSYQLRDHRALVTALAAAQQHVQQLIATNAATEARISTIAQSVVAPKPKSTPTASVHSPPPLGGQGGNDSASDGSDWMIVQNVAYQRLPQPKLSYRLANANPGSQSIHGRSVVVFGGTTLPEKLWQAVPNVALIKGHPMQGRTGSRFAIRYFKDIGVPVPPTARPWSFVVVYVFDAQGLLRLTHHHKIDDAANKKDAHPSTTLDSNT